MYANLVNHDRAGACPCSVEEFQPQNSCLWYTPLNLMENSQPSIVAEKKYSPHRSKQVVSYQTTTAVPKKKVCMNANQRWPMQTTYFHVLTDAHVCLLRKPDMKPFNGCLWHFLNKTCSFSSPRKKLPYWVELYGQRFCISTCASLCWWVSQAALLIAQGGVSSPVMFCIFCPGAFDQ